RQAGTDHPEVVGRIPEAGSGGRRAGVSGVERGAANGLRQAPVGLAHIIRRGKRGSAKAAGIAPRRHAPGCFWPFFVIRRDAMAGGEEDAHTTVESGRRNVLSGTEAQGAEGSSRCLWNVLRGSSESLHRENGGKVEAFPRRLRPGRLR